LQERVQARAAGRVQHCNLRQCNLAARRMRIGRAQQHRAFAEIK
jgi:hypothetical protein